MARKPLIEPGSVLPGGGVLDRIIANDAAKHGRSHSPTPSDESKNPSNEASIIASNEQMKPPSHDDMNTSSNDDVIKHSHRPSHAAQNTPSKEGKADEAGDAAWTDAMREALDAQIRAHLMRQMMAQNEKGPVTRLNVEMAEDLHLRLKQSCVIKRRPIKAVINALIAFYLEQEGA